MRSLDRRSAFSIIELLVVISIISILLGLLFPAINRVRQRARIQEAKAMIGTLEVSINMYYADLGTYPPSANWESLLVNGSGDYGPYIDTKKYANGVFEDPWGNVYHYDIDNPHNIKSFDLWSTGPGEGDTDDITNW